VINREKPTRAQRFVGYAAVLAMGLIVGATAQAAQVPPDQGSTDTSVSGVDVATMIQPADWISMPRSFALFAFLPSKVQKSGITGKVVLKCRVLSTASVSDCTVISDTNPDGILGEAALKASGLFKIKPRAVNGTLSDKAWVLIPISYNLGRMRSAGEPAN
jgi:TonB family protein